MVFLAVVLVGLPAYFEVWPMFEERATKTATRNQLQADVDKLNAVAAKLIEYENRSRQLEAELETLRSRLPDEQATDIFMKRVFARAAEAEIHIRTFIPMPQVKKDFYIETPFSVRIDGTYWRMVSFFTLLAKETRIITVPSIDLGPPAGGGKGAYTLLPDETVGANTTITTYFNNPQPPAAAAAPVPAPRR